MAKGDDKRRAQTVQAGYKDIAATGGYNPQMQQDIRERAMSPIRAAYSNAMMNINRQRALQGGYSPNYGAVQAKAAREQGQTMSDASQNVNMNLAQAILGNKMAGLAGLQGAPSTEGTPWWKKALNVAAPIATVAGL